jgi:curli biogenesis system outer membrane secretion channel CsgG
MKSHTNQQFLAALLCVLMAIPAVAQAPASKAAPAMTVAKIIQMVKMKMPEATILQSIKANKKSLKPTVDDLMNLKEAGASDAIINEISGAESAPAAAPAANPMPRSAPDGAAPPSAAPVMNVNYNTDFSTLGCASTAPEKRKRVVAIEEFDYAAVKSAAQAVFGTDVDLGKGMRALLIKRMSDSGKFRLVERAKIKQVMGEQDFGASGRVKQGTQARIGRIIGADIILAGDITVFGRDDKHKQVGGGGGNGLPGAFGGIRVGSREDKAVVQVNIRLVDVESSEILQASEAKGESSRKGTNFAIAGFGNGGAGGGGGFDMGSSNFAESIVGEATIKAIDGVAGFLDANENKIPERSLDAEGKIATVEGAQVYLSIGSNDFVSKCDRFKILKVIKEVKDPATGEVLDVVTAPVGQAVVTDVRDRISICAFNGSSAPQVGYLARKVK